MTSDSVEISRGSPLVPGSLIWFAGDCVSRIFCVVIRRGLVENAWVVFDSEGDSWVFVILQGERFEGVL